MQDLVDGAGDQRGEAVELERGGHGVGQPHERLPRVVALSKEEPVDQRLRPRVHAVHQEDDHERHQQRRHHARHGEVEPREQHVEPGQQARVAEGDGGGDHGVHGARAHDGADVEELVAHDGVGHRQREDEGQPPQLGEVGDRLVQHDLGRGAEDGQQVPDAEAGEQDPRPLADQRGGAQAGGPAEADEQLHERGRPVDGDGARGGRPRVPRHRRLQPEPERRRQHVRNPHHARPAPRDGGPLGQHQRQVREQRGPQGPRQKEELREAMRAGEVDVADVDEDGGETEGEEEPRRARAGLEQRDDGAQAQDEDSAGEVVDDEALEVPQTHPAARDLLLHERAAADEQVAQPGAGRVALDLLLQLARGADETAIHRAHEVERLGGRALGAADADEHVLHHRKAGPRPADHAPGVARDRAHEDHGEQDEQKVGRLFEPRTTGHRLSLPQTCGAPSAQPRPTSGPKRAISSVSERLPALASAASESGFARSSGLRRIM